MTEKEKADLENKVKLVLESVRPYLLADGGDIQFVSLTDALEVEVFLTGACHACGMSFQTLAGVESALKNAIPEISRVIVPNYGFE